MNKFAEVKNGEIVYIYSTELSKSELSNIFNPKTIWIDVTDKECDIGWKVYTNERYEVVLEPPIETSNKQLTAEVQNERIKKRLLRVVDRYLDKTVQERGYDNIAKCVTYEGDIDPIFNAEGTAAKQWRSKVYRHLYNVLAQVEAGEREIPTAQELIEELPKIEWETVNEQ